MKKLIYTLLILLSVVLVSCGTEPTKEVPTEAPSTQAPETTEAETKALFNDEDYVGLVVSVPEEVKFTLYKGFNKSSGVKESETKVIGSEKRLYYANLAAGDYTYVAKKTGYYTLTKNLLIWPKQKHTFIDANPGKREGAHYEAGDVLAYTDELYANVLVTKKDEWTDVKEAFETPYFTRESYEVGKNRQTSNDEAEAFLKGLAAATKEMAVFSYGTSPQYGLNMMAAVFAKDVNFDDCTTYEMAAERVKAAGRPTVLVMGGMHGNEPAGAEGTLAISKYLATGDGHALLDKLNIVVVPRVNPEGMYNYTRKNVANDIDMNRDHLHLKAYEVVELHKLYQTFGPLVTIDMHEYTAKNDSQNSDTPYYDIYSSTGPTMWEGEDIQNFGLNALRSAFEGLRAKDFTCHFYPYEGVKTVNTNNLSTGRSYYAFNGTVTFLIESRGINADFSDFQRRVVAHMITCKGLLEYCAANVDTLKSTVKAEQESIVARGATYDPSSVLPLETRSSKISHGEFETRNVNFLIGDVSGKSTECHTYFIDEVVASRTRPTAYVVPKDAAGADEVVRLLGLHLVECVEAAPGTKISLRQYQKESGNVKLSGEKTVTFEKGAYVFQMDQVTANILAIMMEPDTGDAKDYKGTFVQNGVLGENADGTYPIYRFEHNLSQKTW